MSRLIDADALDEAVRRFPSLIKSIGLAEDMDLPSYEKSAEIGWFLYQIRAKYRLILAERRKAR